MSGSRWNKEVETRGRLPFVKESFTVDQQVTLDASESEVPVAIGDRRLVVAGFVNQARRLCFSYLSESTPPVHVYLSTSEGGGGKGQHFLRLSYADRKSNGTLPFGGLVI